MRVYLHKVGIGDRKIQRGEKENDDVFDGSKYRRHYAGWAAELR